MTRSNRSLIESQSIVLIGIALNDINGWFQSELRTIPIERCQLFNQVCTQSHNKKRQRNGRCNAVH